MSETHNIDSHLFEELKSLRQRVSALEGMEAELQRVRQALRHSERQFQLLRDNVADIVRRRMASRPAAPDPEAEAFELEQTEPEIRLRLQGMALLSRINASIGTAEDLDATLHQVCADLARILYLPQASLALFNPERTAAQVIAERHPPHSPPTLGTLLPVAGNPSMTYILEHKGPLMMVNAPMDPSPAAVPGAMPQRRVQSILLVPLLVGNEAIGTLDIGAFERREFSPFEIDLACAVANQVGQVLVRKKAEEALRRERDLAESMQAEIRQHTAQLEALREVGLELAAELNLDDLLYSIVSRAMSLVSGASGGMYLYRPDLDVIEWAISIGPQPDTYGAILHRGEGQSGKVWASGQSLVVDDYSRWEGRAAIYDQYNFKGIVAVPVRWGTQFLGVINVMADSVGAFSPADAELLELFAYQAAIAIRNAQLFRETQRQLAELALLFDTSAALSTSLDVDTVVDTIAHQIAAALDTEQCAISLWDREQETLETRLDYARHPGRQGRPPKTPGSRHPGPRSPRRSC
jgi:GAF domain-containing protein